MFLYSKQSTYGDLKKKVRIHLILGLSGVSSLLGGDKWLHEPGETSEVGLINGGSEGWVLAWLGESQPGG